jgi:BA14K-like protein
MLKWMGWPLAAALAFAPLGAAAAPAVSRAAPAVSAAGGSGVAQVQYRRHGGFGAGLGVGLGIGVLGAIIANEAYRPRAGYYYDDYAYNGPYEEPADFAGDPRSLCAQRFRSFEWNTGLYTTFSGEKRVCPYLR